MTLQRILIAFAAVLFLVALVLTIDGGHGVVPLEFGYAGAVAFAAGHL
jgi:hypothetical protein